MTKRSIVLAAVFVLAFEAFSETVRTASQPWVTNNVAQAVAPVTAGVATNAAMIAALDNRVDKAALNWVYIPDPSSPWTCTMSGKELLLDYVGPIVSSESFSFRWQCSTNFHWWLEYVVYRKWSNSSPDGNFWECGGEWRHKAGEEDPRCYEPCDANSLSFTTAIGAAITMTRDMNLFAEPALLRNAYLNDIWGVEEDVATNAARIAEMETDVAALAAETNTYLTTETDPTVYDWAKAVTKPSYAYSEIAGTPDLGQYSTTGAVAQVARDLSAVSNIAASAVQTETDPTVPSWAKVTTPPYLTEHQSLAPATNYTDSVVADYLPLSGGVVTGSVFIASSTNDILVAVGEQTYGRFSVPAIGTYPDRSIDYEDERTIAALMKEDDMPLVRLERIKHGRYSTYDSFTNGFQTIEYEKAELDMDGLGHVRIDKDGNSVACDIRWPTPPDGTNYISGTIALLEHLPGGGGSIDLSGYATTGALAQVESDLSNHLSATNNPHHVTAAQIGALTPSGGTVHGDIKLVDDSNLIVSAGESSSANCIRVNQAGFELQNAGQRYHVYLPRNDGTIALMSELAPAYDYQAHTVGDVCSDGGKIYRCIQSYTPDSMDGPENDPYHWEPTTLLSVAESDVAAATNALGALAWQSAETDPTVPSWAKASSKPGYSYSEISDTPDLGGYATTAALDAGTNTVAGLGARIFYGTCATSASTAAKVVTCAGFKTTDLKAGTVLWVRFTNAQTYNGAPTINVNSTGAVNVKRVGTTNAARYEWVAGELICFVHDGSFWTMTDGGLATTSDYGATKLSTTATSTGTTLALTPASLNSFSQGMIAPYPVYSKTGMYEPGDRVRYSYNSYICKASVISQDWSEASWQMIDPIQTQLDVLRPSGPIATESVVRATSGDACRVSLASGATLSAALDVEGVPVMGLIEPAGAYSVSPSIHLLGYGTWPTNSFQAVFWRLGQTTYANVLSEL